MIAVALVLFLPLYGSYDDKPLYANMQALVDAADVLYYHRHLCPDELHELIEDLINPTFEMTPIDKRSYSAVPHEIILKKDDDEKS